ncbi:conserved hypothetical protein [Beutenbergia cavernae DSM 12333]|uniref:Sodium:proton antiporter n=1 Tax=Beutenbergia cavernae (strain ATCC BAA-8 / DSM 12333 / CCUG 43141 / JCM 11478 / NBRC 16432 / NCIMB 13614 / HKI 0122) TaxID=471853 RepID=C5C4G0_BEUC1|nr:DUF6328 family protein [Beutenbergia cavernae]ACQ82084.1 conserved hypothetical protein [Beutenbergia cavernae DSM 12333]
MEDDSETTGRDETRTERADRNWDELLQELRVTQTGTQILTGFLLTLPFQQRFAELSSEQVAIYLCLVGLALLATALVVAPVSIHRVLFQQRRKAEIVDLGSTLARVGLVALALVVTGTALFIFDVVAGRTAGLVAAGAVILLLVVVWVIVPGRLHRGRQA